MSDLTSNSRPSPSDKASALGSFSLLARAALVDGALANRELQLLSAFAGRVGLSVDQAQERLDHLRQGAGLRIRPPRDADEARERLADVAAMIASDGFLDPAELALLEKIAAIFKLPVSEAHTILEQMPQRLGMPPKPALPKGLRWWRTKQDWHVPLAGPSFQARISPLAPIVGLCLMIWGLISAREDGLTCLLPLGSGLLGLGVFHLWYVAPALRKWLTKGRLCRAFIHSFAWRDHEGEDDMGMRFCELELGLLDGGLRLVKAPYPALPTAPQPGRCVWACIHPDDPQRVLVHRDGLLETRTERRVVDTPLR